MELQEDLQGDDFCMFAAKVDIRSSEREYVRSIGFGIQRCTVSTLSVLCSKSSWHYGVEPRSSATVRHESSHASAPASVGASLSAQIADKKSSLWKIG